MPEIKTPGKNLQKLLPFLTLAALFIALWVASPTFLTQRNLSAVVRQTAVINIMALGMTAIIIPAASIFRSAPSSLSRDCWEP